MHPGQGPGLSLHDLGETGGSDTVTLLESEMPAHSHAWNALERRSGTHQSPARRVHGRGTSAGSRCTRHRQRSMQLQPQRARAGGWQSAAQQHAAVLHVLLLHRSAGRLPAAHVEVEGRCSLREHRLVRSSPPRRAESARGRCRARRVARARGGRSAAPAPASPDRGSAARTARASPCLADRCRARPTVRAESSALLRATARTRRPVIGSKVSFLSLSSIAPPDIENIPFLVDLQVRRVGQA